MLFDLVHKYFKVSRPVHQVHEGAFHEYQEDDLWRKNAANDDENPWKSAKRLEREDWGASQAWYDSVAWGLMGYSGGNEFETTHNWATTFARLRERECAELAGPACLEDRQWLSPDRIHAPRLGSRRLIRKFTKFIRL